MFNCVRLLERLQRLRENALCETMNGEQVEEEGQPANAEEDLAHGLVGDSKRTATAVRWR